MANSETVDIPLTGGLNLDDDKALPPGDFAVLDNADFEPLRKRHGHERLNVWISGRTNWLGGYAATDAWAYGFGQYLTHPPDGAESVPVAEVGNVRGVATLQDDLLAWDGFRLFSYDSSPSAGWNRIATNTEGQAYGNAVFAHAKESSPVSAPSATNFEVAVGRHRTLYCWIESTTAYYAIVANATGGVVVPRTALSTDSSSATHAKPVYLTTPDQTAGTFFVHVNDSSAANGYYTTISELDSAIVADGTLFTDKSAIDNPADVVAYGNTAYVLYVATGPVLKLATYSANGTTSTTTLNIDTRTPTSSRPVGLAVHPDGTVMAFWYNTAATAVYAAFYGASTFSRIYSAVAVTTDTPQRLSCQFRYLKSSSEYEGNCAWWVLATNTTKVRHVYGDSVGGTAQLGDCRLTHQLQRVGNSNFITVGYSRSGTLQYQLVTLHIDKNLLSTTLTPVASSFRQTYYPSSDQGFWTLAANRTTFNDDINGHKFALGLETGSLLPTATSVQQVKANVARLDLDYMPPLRTERVGDSLWFSGGVVKEYDGNTLHEAGFLTYPQISSALVAGGSLPTTGAPQYRAYLIYRNAKGELHRSAAISHTATTPSGGNLTVRLTLPMVPFCTHSTAQWEIYRLDYLASSFRRLAVVDVGTTARYTDTTYDDTGAISVTDKAIDPAPSFAPNGLGTLDRICPPSCTIIKAGKERVWFAGGGVPNGQVAYSRLYDPGEAPAWNEALTLNVPGDGEVTGLGFLGDWLCAFRETSIHVAGGPGPDNLGSGDFDAPRLVNADTGCISTDSIVLLASGLAFQSSGGIALLPHSLGVAPIGEPVRAATGEGNRVFAACVSPLWHQARFATESGDVYVLDYATKPRWTLWTVPTNGMCQWQGRIAVAADDNSVLVEQAPGDLGGTDGKTGYDFNAVTGWLKPAASGGINDFDWWYLLGTWHGPGDIYARVDFDYRLVGPNVDEKIWSPTTAYSSTVVSDDTPTTVQDFGPADLSDSTFGSGSPSWYPTSGALDIRRRFKRRRAAAVRFQVRTVGEGAGPSISGLSVEYRPGNRLMGK